VSRNITPRPIRAAGARDTHGRILDGNFGALYVHMHRESGLAHRHYVLKPWQVRVLSVVTSRPMLVLYVVAIVGWSWMASQAARVPLLKQEIATLTTDALRLDTLTATLAELQGRYDHVQRLLSVANAGARGPATVEAPVAKTVLPPATAAGKSAARPDSSNPPEAR
jgi:hypothetical protein